MYSEIKCVKGEPCQIVCTSAHCEQYPFLCGGECCEQSHSTHSKMTLQDFFQQLLKCHPQQGELDDWYYMIDEALKKTEEELADLRSHHQQWYRQYLDRTFRYHVMKQKILNNDLHFGNNLSFSGIDICRLLNESNLVQTKKPNPYSIQSKVQIVDVIGPTLQAKAQELKSFIRKYYDCRAVFEKIVLTAQSISALDPHTDEVLITNSTVQEETGWAGIIDGLSNLKFLRNLQIKECGINDEVVELISTKLPRLMYLDLRSNKINRRGAKTLVKLKRLEELNLSYNQIGDSAAMAIIQGLPELRTLSLFVNNITSETQAEIRKKIGYAIDIYF